MIDGLVLILSLIFAAIMTSGHKVRAQFKGNVQKHIKFNFAISQHIGIWRTAILVFPKHIIDNTLLIFGAQIDRLKWNA